jgi:hypothetical protein
MTAVSNAISMTTGLLRVAKKRERGREVSESSSLLSTHTHTRTLKATDPSGKLNMGLPITSHPLTAPQFSVSATVLHTVFFRFLEARH